MRNSLQNSMVGLRYVISHGNFGLLDRAGRGSSQKLQGTLDGSDEKRILVLDYIKISLSPDFVGNPLSRNSKFLFPSQSLNAKSGT